MNTRLNLTGLADLANAELAAKGKPLAIPLDDIHPDPDNPRNADDENTPAAIEAQEELDADVAERGVKTPISVRPHPTIASKYVINYGHRRYLSARRNNLVSIPAFVDERFDSYDQFNENELRRDLTTRARALFIKSRLDAGDTKGEIAQRMRKKNQNFITEHLALIDAPDCVNRAYADGVTSARTLYDLRQAWQEFPMEIESWCRGSQRITRDAIKEVLTSFRCARSTVGYTQVDGHAEPSSHGFRHDEILPQVSTPSSSPANQKFRHDEKLTLPDTQRPAATPQFRHDGKETQALAQLKTTSAAPKGSSCASDIIVQYRGQLARIMRDATVSIIVDGQGVPLEVPLTELVFN